MVKHFGKMSYYELENLLIDPDYYRQEYFLKIENKIDIEAEERKREIPENAEEINKKRQELLEKLNEYEEKCKQLIKDGVFKQEIDKIQQFFDEFDPKEENIQQKLEENINIMKEILLNFREYYFKKNEDNKLYLGYIKSKVNRHFSIL